MGDDVQARMARLLLLRHLHLAGEDQHQPLPRLPGPRQIFAGREAAARAEPLQPVQLCGIEGRKHLRATLGDDGLLGVGHAFSLPRLAAS